MDARVRRLRAMFARLKEFAEGGGAPRYRGRTRRKGQEYVKAYKRRAVKTGKKKSKKPIQRGVKWRTLTEGV